MWVIGSRRIGVGGAAEGLGFRVGDYGMYMPGSVAGSPVGEGETVTDSSILGILSLMKPDTMSLWTFRMRPMALMDSLRPRRSRMVPSLPVSLTREALLPFGRPMPVLPV